MAAVSVMVAIYRDSTYDNRFKSIYFTELDDHGRDSEIGRAMKGEQVWGGFLSRAKIEEARGVVNRIVQRLNDGEKMSEEDIDHELQPYKAS